MKDYSSEYKQYYIAKKNGSRRLIQEPKPDLKEFQRDILKQLIECPSDFSWNTSSAKELAKKHQSHKYFLQVDIKDCFQNTTYDKIVMSFESQRSEEIPLFALVKQLLPYCLLPNENGIYVLPTGAPTSPFLCNMVLRQIDNRFYEVYGHRTTSSNIFSNQDLAYSRYLDDITVSVSPHIHQRPWRIINTLKEIVLVLGYQYNEKKTRWYTNNASDKCSVTGINLKGDGFTLPRTFKQKVKTYLYFLAKDKKPLNDVAKGYLSYAKSIDIDVHDRLLRYYNDRLI